MPSLRLLILTALIGLLSVESADACCKTSGGDTPGCNESSIPVNIPNCDSGSNPCEEGTGIVNGVCSAVSGAAAKLDNAVKEEDGVLAGKGAIGSAVSNAVKPSQPSSVFNIIDSVTGQLSGMNPQESEKFFADLNSGNPTSEQRIIGPVDRLRYADGTPVPPGVAYASLMRHPTLSPENKQKVRENLLLQAQTQVETNPTLALMPLERLVAEIASMPEPMSKTTEVREDRILPASQAEFSPFVTVTQGLVQKLPDHPIANELHAKVLYHSGDDDEGAFNFFSRAIERGRETPENFYMRGAVADRLGDYNQANDDARRVLQMKPEHKQAKSLFQLTKNQVSSSKRNLAQENLLLASAGGIMPQKQGEAPKGAALTQQDALRRAQDDANRSASPVKRSDERAKQASTALSMGDFKGAADKAAEAAEINPANAGAYAVGSWANIYQEKYNETVKLASFGLTLNPRSVQMLNARALAHNRTKKYRPALTDAALAVSLNPRSGLGHFNKGYAYSGLGRRKESMEELAQSARLDSRFVDIYKDAATLPPEEDLLALFDGPLFRRSQDGAAAPGGGSWKRVAGMLGGALGFLALFYLWRRDEREPTVTGAGATPIPEGGVWSGYDVQREIAAGGMGVVYEAIDRGLDRKVAIKKMLDAIRNDSAARDRFLGEARMVAKMRHPNIVEIFAIETEGSDAYLIFEYVEGKTVHELIAEKGRLGPQEVRDIMQGTCEAIDFAHARGVVHRDLKPSNIMVDSEGTPKVMDFGVARQGAEELTHLDKTNTVCGTPLYMAPEQEEGVVGRETDIYALGLCMYEMLAGCRPFAGTPGAMLLNKREGKFRPVTQSAAGLPKEIDAVINRALAPSPEDRFHSAKELFAAFEAATALGLGRSKASTGTDLH